MAEMARRQDPAQVHCYTNPSFCRQSEYIPEDSNSESSADLPPPPQFQVDDLPPPPAVHAPQPQYGHSNPAFHGSPETDLTNQPPRQILHRSTVNLNQTTADRYCYIDDGIDQHPPPSPLSSTHKRYGSLNLGDRRAYAYKTHRYEYIQDDATIQVQVQQLQQQQQQQQQLQRQQQQIAAISASNTSRYGYIEQQQVQQRTPQRAQSVISPQNSVRASIRSYRSTDGHYSSLGHDGVQPNDVVWHEEEGQKWTTPKRQINTPRGRYASVPMQDEDPPNLPDRNIHETSSQRVNNLATQKLHEILTTPRKPRSRSQGDLLSPIKSPRNQPILHNVTPNQRNALTPGCTPPSGTSHRTMNSPQQPTQQQTTPQSRALSPRGQGPTTSTPNKEPPSARRCLPLNEPTTGPMVRRHIEDSQHQQQVIYGRSSIPGQPQRFHIEDESVIYAEQKKKAQVGGFYDSVESAFIARTAVVPPLSPQMSSDANSTLVSDTKKSDRKNAPIILILVGILTCGLAIYLSYTQGRKYYFDSAISCGACCALAGACRSMRRTWTGLGLAGLAALSCGGLLLLAAKAPKPGTPMHDVTAGALCGVSILGATLALLALLAPKCTFGRHRRVHSWIPRFQP